jgi:hypothetical protein
MARPQTDMVTVEHPQTTLYNAASISTASVGHTNTSTPATVVAYIQSNYDDHHQQQSIQHHLEDHSYSTDSSSLGGDEVKRRRKKLHFPFTKKSKSKNA